MAEQEQKQEKVVQMPEFAKPKETDPAKMIERALAEFTSQDEALAAEARGLVEAIQAAQQRFEQIKLERVRIKGVHDGLSSAVKLFTAAKPEQSGAKE